MGWWGVNGTARYVQPTLHTTTAFTCAQYPYLLPQSHFSRYRVFQVDDEQDDEQSQLIQSQLGSFDDAKPYLDLVFSCGITGMPQSPAPPPPSSSSSSSSTLPAAAGMMHHHSSSSYPSSANAAAAAKSHHHVNAAAATVVGQQQSSRRSVSPASGGGSAPASVGSFKKPTVTSHAMARSSSSSSSSNSGSSSSSAHFQPPANPPRYVPYRIRRDGISINAVFVHCGNTQTVRGILLLQYSIFSHSPHNSITPGISILTKKKRTYTPFPPL